jgi:hypothetical protein
MEIATMPISPIHHGRNTQQMPMKRAVYMAINIHRDKNELFVNLKSRASTTIEKVSVAKLFNGQAHSMATLFHINSRYYRSSFLES